MVGDNTVPLALMLVGSGLAKSPPRQRWAVPRVWGRGHHPSAAPVLFSGVCCC